MFDLIENELFAWPSSVGQAIPEEPIDLISIARLIRQQKWLRAEAYCLNFLIDPPDVRAREISLWLLCLLFLNSFRSSRAKEIYFFAASCTALTLPWCYLRFRLYASDSGFHDQERLNLSDEIISNIKKTEYSVTLFAAYFGLLNNFTSPTTSEFMQSCMNRFPMRDSLEYVRAFSKFLCITGRPVEAVQQLFNIQAKSAENYGYWVQFCETALIAQDSALSLHALKKLYGILGNHPRVLPLLLQVKLLQRQPSLARRSALLLRTVKSADLSALNTSTASANQLTSLEYCGNVEWFPYLLSPFLSVSNDRNGAGLANMIYHLSSIESPLSQDLAKDFFGFNAICQPSLKKLSLAESEMPKKNISFKPDNNLRVAWITPDVGPHPVSRFLFSFLSNANCENTSHVVLSTSPNRPDESWLLNDFSSLRNVQAAHIPPVSIQSSVDKVRSMDFDVVVD